MKMILAGLVTLAVLTGCNSGKNRETGQVADTTVGTRQMQDTTIVTSDTSVQTDTVKQDPGKTDSAKSD